MLIYCGTSLKKKFQLILQYLCPSLLVIFIVLLTNDNHRQCLRIHKGYCFFMYNLYNCISKGYQ